jgi:hypothetical protein
MEDLGGVEPLARGLKARCPTASGLNAPGPLSSCAAASRAVLILVIIVISFCFLVLPHGIEPRSSGYRPGALPLSYGRGGGARSRTRTWGCRCVRPMPWPLGEASALRRSTPHKQGWCTREELNLHAARAAVSEAAASLVSPRVHSRALVLVLAGGLEPPASRLRGERSAR